MEIRYKVVERLREEVHARLAKIADSREEYRNLLKGLMVQVGRYRGRGCSR